MSDLQKLTAVSQYIKRGMSCSSCKHWREKEYRHSPVCVVYLHVERAEGICCRQPEAKHSSGHHHCGQFEAHYDSNDLFDTAAALIESRKRLELRTAQKKELERKIQKLKLEVQKLKSTRSVEGA